MTDKKTKAQKLAYLEQLATLEDHFFHDYSLEIMEYLQDEDDEVRAQAVRSLWEYLDLDHIDLLMELAEHDMSTLVRQKALSGLGRYIWEGAEADHDFGWGELEELMREDELPQAEFERVRDYLWGVIHDERRPLDERRRALEAISFHDAPEILDLIEQAYHHPDKRMKISAIFAMGRSGIGGRWEKYVLEALHSPDPEIEYEAVRAAGELYLESANRPLMRLASGAEDKDLRLEAIWALGQIAHQESFWLLEELQLNPDLEIQRMAKAALNEWLMFSEFRDLEDEDFLDLDELEDEDFLDLDDLEDDEAD